MCVVLGHGTIKYRAYDGWLMREVDTEAGSLAEVVGCISGALR